MTGVPVEGLEEDAVTQRAERFPGGKQIRGLGIEWSTHLRFFATRYCSYEGRLGGFTPINTARGVDLAVISEH